MKTISHAVVSLGFTALLLVSCAAPEMGAPAAAQTVSAPFDRDRAAILAMAGDYRVRFDMRETVPFLADYKLLAPKIAHGHEAVRVIEDSGNVIRLQHLLVVTDKGKDYVIKHWRQDWVYEPVDVLVYGGKGFWNLQPLALERRRGAWSQTVWQTDDSPRYGGIGRWVYDDGVARWQSDETWRPLARRDAVRKPPYDRYLGVNRHALTPSGWVHEQDNAKIGTRDGKSVTFTHEVVLNSYDKSSDFNVKAADAYWVKTAAYWTEVRKDWDNAIARNKGITVTEEADSGSSTGRRLMDLGDALMDGKITTADAVIQARMIIEKTGKQTAAMH